MIHLSNGKYIVNSEVFQTNELSEIGRPRLHQFSASEDAYSCFDKEFQGLTGCSFTKPCEYLCLTEDYLINEHKPQTCFVICVGTSVNYSIPLNTK